ncbi:MAG TPA: hypothetical protein VH590_14150, partial [Ktedonobacterales bacterium]
MPAEHQQEAPEHEALEQDSWHPLEQRLGWRFRQPQLLREALTHRSYVYESPEQGLAPNERLEFLGDAILGFLCAEYLFRAYPTLS